MSRVRVLAAAALVCMLAAGCLAVEQDQAATAAPADNAWASAHRWSWALHDSETAFTVELTPGATATVSLHFDGWTRDPAAQSSGIAWGHAPHQGTPTLKAEAVLGEGRQAVSIYADGIGGQEVGPAVPSGTRIMNDALVGTLVGINWTHETSANHAHYTLAATDGWWNVTVHVDASQGQARIIDIVQDPGYYRAWFHPNPSDWDVAARVGIAGWDTFLANRTFDLTSDHNMLLLTAPGPGSRVDLTGAFRCSATAGTTAASIITGFGLPAGEYNAGAWVTAASTFPRAALHVFQWPDHPDASDATYCD